MTVAELIELLKTMPQDLHVGFDGNFYKIKRAEVFQDDGKPYVELS